MTTVTANGKVVELLRNGVHIYYPYSYEAPPDKSCDEETSICDTTIDFYTPEDKRFGCVIPDQ